MDFRQPKATAPHQYQLHRNISKKDKVVTPEAQAPENKNCTNNYGRAC
jgi:hypothetical protein